MTASPLINAGREFLDTYRNGVMKTHCDCVQFCTHSPEPRPSSPLQRRQRCTGHRSRKTGKQVRNETWRPEHSMFDLSFEEGFLRS